MKSKVIAFIICLTLFGATVLPVSAQKIQYLDPGNPWDANTGQFDPTGGDQYSIYDGDNTSPASLNTNCRSLKSGKVVIRDVLDFVTCTISSSLIPLIVALAVLVFIWGIVQYISSGDDEEKRKTGRDFMVYGLIGLFVMMSFWGIINIFRNSFGVDTIIPQLNQ